MTEVLKKIVKFEHYWKVLIVLALATIAVLPFSRDFGQMAALMINAYALVAFAAMLNRSSTKNSWAYHGIVLLLNSVAGYWVFKSVDALVTTIGLTYFLIIAYIAATVWGNFTGSKLSMIIEKKLGVVTRLKGGGNNTSPQEKKVKYALLIILGVLAVAILIITRGNYFAAVSVFFLNFLNMGIHTFVRRSRNVGNTIFHNTGLLLQGLSYFLLFRFIAAENMSWIFFLPYAMGSILGGLLTHTFNMWAEKRIKADPDKHLIKPTHKVSRFAFDIALFPWKILLALFGVAVVMIFIAPLLATIIVGLALIQYAVFISIKKVRIKVSHVLVDKKIKTGPEMYPIKPVKKFSHFTLDASLLVLFNIMVMLIICSFGRINEWLTLMTKQIVFFQESPGLIAIIVGLAVAQYIAFTLISRARTRKNRTYEAYSSMASNGTWLAMFGKLNMQGWSAPLFLPYVAGVMIGGNLGVGIAMHIERWFGIASD